MDLFNLICTHSQRLQLQLQQHDRFNGNEGNRYILAITTIFPLFCTFPFISTHWSDSIKFPSSTKKGKGTREAKPKGKRKLSVVY